jgi:exodeoxyribonuclease VIII
MQPGFYPHLSNDEYHDAPGFSKTTLCELTPFDYWANRIYTGPKPEREEPEAFLVGNAFHCRVLEPQHFGDRYACNSGKLRRGSKDYDEWREANPGKTLLSETQWNLIEQMATMASFNPSLVALFAEPGISESSFFAIAPETGELVKCKPDRLYSGGRIVVDLKTAGDLKASTLRFPWHAHDLHYHVSAALTLDVIELVTGQRPEQYLFAVVEKSWPHRSAAYTVTEPGIELGREYYLAKLRLFRLCREMGYWPAYVAGGQREKVNPHELFKLWEP